ncbi:hypothetical protein B0H19DRAFT_1274002 [Mycena capillaripes]|nr:hypothetical protein B0H19DRAFT_1274002 [Mycena capillaripes]
MNPPAYHDAAGEHQDSEHDVEMTLDPPHLKAGRYFALPFQCRGFGECRMVFSRSEHFARHIRGTPMSWKAPLLPTQGRHNDIGGLLESWERRQLSLSMRLDPQSRHASSLPFQYSSEQIEEQITKRLIAILDSKDDMRAVGQLRSRDIQSLLDAIQEVLNRGSLPSSDYRSRALRLRRKLSEAHDQLPSSLFIYGVHDHDEYPTFSGGFGDVFRASFRFATYPLALVWQGLNHRFILPLIGIDRETFPSSLCMASPWMKNGTVLKYLRDHGTGDVHRLFARTPASDIYAYSCVCLELHMGRPPFADVMPDVAAMLRVIAGERPPRPPAMSDGLWHLVSACWVQDFRTRPKALELVQAFSYQ